MSKCLKKFEYTRIYCEVDHNELDMMGEAGWELVAIELSKSVDTVINATYRFFKVGDLLVTTLVNGKDGVQILDYLLAIFQYGLVLVHAIQNVITISHDGVDLVKDRVPVTRYGNVISNFYRHHVFVFNFLFLSLEPQGGKTYGLKELILGLNKKE